MVKKAGESTEQQVVENTPDNNNGKNLEPKKLDILGQDPSTLNQREVKLHPDLIPRWKHWLSSGLTDQVREELLKKYPRKGDCLLEPPQLNPEVKIPMNDVSRKRDDHFQDIQRLAGSALSAIGPAISNLVGEAELNPLHQLELLSDTGKLIIDLHHSVSKARRAFITPGYSKSVKEILDLASDNQAFLFGEKLSEKVSEVKSLEKTSKDMKPSFGRKNLAPKSSGSLNTKSSSSRKFNTSRLSNRYPSQTNQSNFRGTKSTPASYVNSSTSASSSEFNQVSEGLKPTETIEVRRAGRLQRYFREWSKSMSDKFVLGCIKGFKIPFAQTPKQSSLPRNRNWSQKETVALRLEISRLLEIGQ